MIPPSPFLPLEGKALSWLSTTAGGALVRPPAQGKPAVPIVRPSPFDKTLLGLLSQKSLTGYPAKDQTGNSAPPCNTVGEGTPCRGPTGRCMIRNRYGNRLRVVPHPASACGKPAEGAPEYRAGSTRTKREKPTVQGEVVTKPTVQQVEDGIKVFMEAGKDTPEARATLLSAIRSLTVQQIHELKRRSGGLLKASGKKQEMVEKLVNRIVARVKPVSQETVKTEEQKIVEEAAKPDTRHRDLLNDLLKNTKLDPGSDAYDAAVNAFMVAADGVDNAQSPEEAQKFVQEFEKTLRELKGEDTARKDEKEVQAREKEAKQEVEKQEEQDKLAEEQPERVLNAQGSPDLVAETPVTESTPSGSGGVDEGVLQGISIGFSDSGGNLHPERAAAIDPEDLRMMAENHVGRKISDGEFSAAVDQLRSEGMDLPQPKTPPEPATQKPIAPRKEQPPGGLKLPDVGKSPFERPGRKQPPTGRNRTRPESGPSAPRTGSRELDAKPSRERDPVKAAVTLSNNLRQAFEASSVRRGGGDVDQLLNHYAGRLTEEQAREVNRVRGLPRALLSRVNNREHLLRSLKAKWELWQREEGR